MENLTQLQQQSQQQSQQQLLLQQEAKLSSKEHILSHLLNYCCYIDPNFMLPDHVLEFGDKLNKFAHNAPGYNKLIISLPPRHGKSYASSIMLPSYLLGLNPKEKILTTTYANELTKVFSKEIIKIVQSPQYTDLFPQTQLVNSGRSANTWDTTAGGYLKCSSRDGTLTGLTGTTIIVDDMIKNSKEAKSPTLLASLKDWFDSTLFSRLTYQDDGTPPKIVILMTRWAKGDLIGHVLDNDDEGDWQFINLPAIRINKNGEEEALWEEKQPIKTLIDIRKRSPEMFGCVYMGQPGEAGTTEFNSKNYIVLDRQQKETKEKILFKFSSWDTASKVSSNHDFTVGTLWAVTRNKLILDAYIRDKYTLPELHKLVKEKHEEWNCKYSIIENASSGIGLLQLLTAESDLPSISSSIRKSQKAKEREFVSITANVNKKLSAVIPLLENHKVELRDFQEILKELEEFPFGNHDDCVASVVNAIYYWMINFMKDRGNQLGTPSVGNPITVLKSRSRVRHRKLKY